MDCWIRYFRFARLTVPILYGDAFDRFGAYTVVLEAGTIARAVGAIGILCIGSPQYGMRGAAL